MEREVQEYIVKIKVAPTFVGQMLVGGGFARLIAALL